MSTLLNAARQAWLGAADFRSRRERYKRYTYGDQWCDTLRDGYGRLLTEAAAVSPNGKRPYSNNLIRQLVKTIVGRFRTIAREQTYYDSRRDSPDRLQGVAELDSRLLEEFLISGMAVQKVTRGRRGVEIVNVDPRLFFVNRYRDARGRDIELIGECLDMSLPELLDRFGHGELDRISRLRDIYRSRPERLRGSLFGESEAGHDFDAARDGKCRVVELWTLDSVSRLMCREPRDGSVYYRDMAEVDELLAANRRRHLRGEDEIEIVPDIEFVWNCRWMSPCGRLLDSVKSPYRRGHPYILRLYPLTDGEIHPFVEDIIDQQRLINRLIMMIDKMMVASAKGVLLFPVGQLPKGVELDDVTEAWSRSDGVIPINGFNNQQMPQQVVTNTQGAGAYQMLELQMRLFDNIAGVGAALRGQVTAGNAGAGLYEQQVQNATIALSDLLETFTAIIHERKEVINELSR